MGCSSCGSKSSSNYTKGKTRKPLAKAPEGKKWIYTRVNGAMRPVLVDLDT